MLSKQRYELSKYCSGKYCGDDCSIACDNPEHRCGRGTSFTKTNADGAYDMSDSEITEAYQSAFGNRISTSVVHPSHYSQGDIECIDAMVAAYGNEAVEVFCLLNAFKYLWRRDRKSVV